MSHDYSTAALAAERARLLKSVMEHKQVGMAVLGSGPEAKEASLRGLAFALEPHRAVFVPINSDQDLAELRPALESDAVEKVGHDLKYAVSILKWHNQALQGPLFDVMLAHSLIEPEMRHSLEYLSEVYLGYSTIAAPQPEKAIPCTSTGSFSPSENRSTASTT